MFGLLIVGLILEPETKTFFDLLVSPLRWVGLWVVDWGEAWFTSPSMSCAAPINAFKLGPVVSDNYECISESGEDVVFHEARDRCNSAVSYGEGLHPLSTLISYDQ